MCGGRLSALSSQVGDDVPHAVVGEEEEFAARLRKVVDPVARVKNLQNHRLVVLLFHDIMAMRFNSQIANVISKKMSTI